MPKKKPLIRREELFRHDKVRTTLMRVIDDLYKMHEGDGRVDATFARCMNEIADLRLSSGGKSYSKVWSVVS